MFRKTRTEQTEWRARSEYVIQTPERTGHASVEAELDCWWTYAPKLISEQPRGSWWHVEAFEGFAEAFKQSDRTPWDWKIAVTDDRTRPEWMVEIGQQVIGVTD